MLFTGILCVNVFHFLITVIRAENVSQLGNRGETVPVMGDRWSVGRTVVNKVKGTVGGSRKHI